MVDLSEPRDTALRNDTAALRGALSRSAAAMTSWWSRSPISGTSRSMCQARIAARSATAEAATLLGRLRGMSGEAQSALDGREIRLAALFQIHRAPDDAAQEGVLLRLRLIVRERLNHGDPAPSVGQQHRSARLTDLTNASPGIHLHVAQGNDVLRERRGCAPDASCTGAIPDPDKSARRLDCQAVLWMCRSVQGVTTRSAGHGCQVWLIFLRHPAALRSRFFVSASRRLLSFPLFPVHHLTNRLFRRSLSAACCSSLRFALAAACGLLTGIIVHDLTPRCRDGYKAIRCKRCIPAR